jgi:uncharacterized membrane protein
MARMVMRGVLAVPFAGAGLTHLIAPHELLKITPDWVPFAPAVILVTGLGELACAAALLTQSLRYWAGIALAIYSLCVWPANFKHAVEGIQIAHVPSTWLYHAPRLGDAAGHYVVVTIQRGRRGLAMAKEHVTFRFGAR